MPILGVKWYIKVMVIYIYLIYRFFPIFGVTVQRKFSTAGSMQQISVMHNPKFLIIFFFIFDWR